MLDEKKNIRDNAIVAKMMKEVSNASQREQRHKTVSIMILAFMVILAFVIAFANASFNWSAIGTAKFWIDFLFTAGGGQFLKWVFGKSGLIEGHKHPDVVAALSDVHRVNGEIVDAELVGSLQTYIAKSNEREKLEAYETKIRYKLRGIILIRKKHWNKEKENVRIARKIMENNFDEKDEKTLYDNNFSMDVIKVKHNIIKESTLNTGHQGGNDNESDDMNFNEMYELFGKSVLITGASIGLSFFLAMIQTEGAEFDGTVVITFFTRVFVYLMNSYVGYSTGKAAVETIKLNKLKKIFGFLVAFKETNKKQEVIVDGN